MIPMPAAPGLSGPNAMNASPAPSPHPLLSVSNLTIRFGDRTVIRDLSFQVWPGDCLAVIGPNGAGKTVLLKALLNLIPYEGEIAWSAGTRPGYVPQKVAADPQTPITAAELLAAKARFLRLPASEAAAVAHDVGLAPEQLATRTSALSGGQFQKVLIAFALLGHPNVLLFDEPTASLDELTEERIYELLRALQEQKGITLILVSHDLSIVYQYARMVLCLSKGEICAGPPEEILTPDRLEHLYGARLRYYRHSHDRGTP
jgi:zinc transport system ATP-binding protein